MRDSLHLTASLIINSNSWNQPANSRNMLILVTLEFIMNYAEILILSTLVNKKTFKFIQLN